MSPFKSNSLAVVLVSAVVFSVAALQGCSSDEQAAPASGGSGGAGHGGSGGKPSTAGAAGTPMSDGGAAGEDGGATAGMGGETSMGGEGGAGPTPSCDLSFDNSTLTAITDNGGELPPLH